MKALQLNFGKVISATAFAALLFVSTASFAGDDRKEKKTEDLPAELTYVGSLNYTPVFQLDLDNTDGESIYISIRNQNGDVLYATNYKGKKFTKRFQFESLEGKDQVIKVVVNSKKKNATQNFQISQSKKIVEEVVVGKI